MFNRISAEIRRLPIGLQLLLFPLFWAVSIPLKAIGWALTEMFGSAKAKAKKTLSPLLWPFAGIVIFLILFVLMGEQGMVLMIQQLMPIIFLILALWMLAFVYKKMFSSFSSSGKKKKKK